jgi:hypothetical protein
LGVDCELIEIQLKVNSDLTGSQLRIN